MVLLHPMISLHGAFSFHLILGSMAINGSIVIMQDTKTNIPGFDVAFLCLNSIVGMAAIIQVELPRPKLKGRVFFRKNR
ncbi:MAG: hypothetical protein ACTSUE_02210 [Promethearchaeota archaeon]